MCDRRCSFGALLFSAGYIPFIRCRLYSSYLVQTVSLLFTADCIPLTWCRLYPSYFLTSGLRHQNSCLSRPLQVPEHPHCICFWNTLYLVLNWDTSKQRGGGPPHTHTLFVFTVLQGLEQRDWHEVPKSPDGPNRWNRICPFSFISKCRQRCHWGV